MKQTRMLSRIICAFALIYSFSIHCFIVSYNSPTDKNGYNNGDFQTNGELLIIKAFIGPNDIVFDAGANKGDWSLIATKQGNISLYAFEPIPSVFYQLKQVLQGPSITLTNKALSNRVGSTEFLYYGKNDQTAKLSGFFERPTVEHNQKMKPLVLQVQTDTLDNFCNAHNIDHIDFLKIDTEGAELLILQGANELLKKNQIKIVQFEYGGTYRDAHITLKEVYTLLRSKGYGVFKIVPDGIAYIEDWNDDLENYQYSNYLATCSRLTDIMFKKLKKYDK